MARFYKALLILFLGGFALVAQEEEKKEAKFASGPAAGSLLPGSFDVYNINGSHKGKFHCLVCEFGHDPVVLIFAREPEEGKDEAFNTLMTKLDEATEKYKQYYLRCFVVFLSPAGRSSATEAKVEDPAKLVEEAMARDNLHGRLEARAAKLKNVVLAYTIPEGPKGYNLHPKAEVTAIFYKKLKVLDNFAFTTGQMDEEKVAGVMDKVEKTLKEFKIKK
jgi:hypothetical protein